MKHSNETSAIGAAAVGTTAALTATLASACCVGPSLAPALISVIGASGLIAITKFRPFTPLFLVVAAAMLSFSFRSAYATSSCNQGGELPRAVKVARVITWTATLLWLFSAGDSLYGFLHE